MAVSLTVSYTKGGSQVADSLEGGGTGIDLGAVNNNSYAPLISKSSNTGKADIYIAHNATIDPITDVKTFIQQYGVGTGFTYGGAVSAAGDIASMIALGNASGNSKNNNDGLSGGLWIDEVWNSTNTTRFDQANFPTKVKIYGDNNTDGISLASAFQFVTDAMVYTSGVETAAISPVAGKIGKSGDSALGDAAHCALRIYLPNSYTAGGVIEWEWVIAYSYTA